MLVDAYACQGRYVYQETAVGRDIGHKVRVQCVDTLNEQDVIVAQRHLGVSELTDSALLEVESGRQDALSCQQILELLVEERQVYGVK